MDDLFSNNPYTITKKSNIEKKITEIYIKDYYEKLLNHLLEIKLITDNDIININENLYSYLMDEL
jgi:hypothetical protein